MRILRLILGDQLNYNHSWFSKVDSNVHYVMMEIRSETDYANHHIQKILGFFGAMREFHKYLKSKGHKITYLKIDDQSNKQDFYENIKDLIKENNIESFEYLEPDEYRLDKYFKKAEIKLKTPSKCFSTEHFMADRFELEHVFGKKDHYLMESFYRHMRKKHRILMKGLKPLGGKWNFDTENRKKLPKDVEVPNHRTFKNNLSDIYRVIEKSDIKTMGNIEDPSRFSYPINREQSLEVLEDFIANHLENFGTYQDAMTEKDPLTFHSRLSFSLNTKMLSPLEVVEAVEKSFKSNKKISISQAEGFIRQIIGWREFMRSFYWVKMPEFARSNFFSNKNKLPDFYWDAKTDMNCLKNCIQSSLDNAYAHHIQRLMVTGNFALLAEVDPNYVDEWYLGIYVDALEWVEITNTRGMSQWADGGGLATKPYVSSANYINKMSDYCKNCKYNHKEKYGENACPFNSLYWHFLEKHKDKLGKNQRMSMVYRVWDKMDEGDQKSTLAQAKKYLNEVDNL